ncbi:MAG: hypothetical protein MHM6MM_006532 [Cercozoa sp. M6MM]
MKARLSSARLIARTQSQQRCVTFPSGAEMSAAAGDGAQQETTGRRRRGKTDMDMLAAQFGKQRKLPTDKATFKFAKKTLSDPREMFFDVVHHQSKHGRTSRHQAHERQAMLALKQREERLAREAQRESMAIAAGAPSAMDREARREHAKMRRHERVLAVFRAEIMDILSDDSRMQAHLAPFFKRKGALHARNNVLSLSSIGFDVVDMSVSKDNKTVTVTWQLTSPRWSNLTPQLESRVLPRLARFLRREIASARHFAYVPSIKFVRHEEDEDADPEMESNVFVLFEEAEQEVREFNARMKQVESRTGMSAKEAQLRAQANIAESLLPLREGKRKQRLDGETPALEALLHEETEIENDELESVHGFSLSEVLKRTVRTIKDKLSLDDSTEEEESTEAEETEDGDDQDGEVDEMTLIEQELQRRREQRKGSMRAQKELKQLHEEILMTALPHEIDDEAEFDMPSSYDWKNDSSAPELLPNMRLPRPKDALAEDADALSELLDEQVELGMEGQARTLSFREMRAEDWTRFQDLRLMLAHFPPTQLPGMDKALRLGRVKPNLLPEDKLMGQLDPLPLPGLSLQQTRQLLSQNLPESTHSGVLLESTQQQQQQQTPAELPSHSTVASDGAEFLDNEPKPELEGTHMERKRKDRRRAPLRQFKPENGPTHLSGGAALRHARRQREHEMDRRLREFYSSAKGVDTYFGGVATQPPGQARSLGDAMLDKWQRKEARQRQRQKRRELELLQKQQGVKQLSGHRMPPLDSEAADTE